MFSWHNLFKTLSPAPSSHPSHPQYYGLLWLPHMHVSLCNRALTVSPYRLWCNSAVLSSSVGFPDNQLYIKAFEEVLRIHSTTTFCFSAGWHELGLPKYKVSEEMILEGRDQWRNAVALYTRPTRSLNQGDGMCQTMWILFSIVSLKN